MSKFLITNVVLGDIVYNIDSKIIGGAELHSASCDTKNERIALRESAQKNNEFVNLDSSMRLSMVVSAQNEKESFYIARQVFSEAIDLWSVFDSVVVGSVRLVDVAFLVDMSTNKIQPFVREKQLLNSVCLHQTVFFPLTLSQALSAYNNKDEFAIRVKRFCHWLRKSTTEEDNQLRILFLWFSIEALLKENEKDNIAPYVSMLIGFCATKQSSAAWASLRTNEKYREYHRLFADNIEKIRIFRNNSVHSGFVPWDISEEDTYLFYYILHNASIKAASAIRSFYMENSCQRNVSCTRYEILDSLSRTTQNLVFLISLSINYLCFA